MQEALHTPVLRAEVRDLLEVRPGMVVIDGTLGDGGHSELFCELVGPSGLVIGIDRDEEALALASARLKSYGARFVAVHGNFKNMPALVRSVTHHAVDRVLLDLGWSTTQFMMRGRGFSFLTNEPLDMRFDPTENTPTAADIVNRAPQHELAGMFRLYGEEVRAEKIARALVSARDREPIRTTQQLAHIIVSVAPRRGKIHPATQVFQALRIVANDELGALTEALKTLVAWLPPRARFGVITFHSLEDRIVKQFCLHHARLAAQSKKPRMPSSEEILNNPRSRSAKLRVFEVRE